MKKTGYENVVPFPQKDGAPKVDIVKIIDDTVANTKRDYVEACMHALLPHIVMMLAESGFDPTDSECLKESYMFVEALKSLMLKTASIDHPLQAVAERAFSTMVETEDGFAYDYEIVDSLFETPKNETEESPT